MLIEPNNNHSLLLSPSLATSTIPLCLYDWESQLKRGDNLILAAFGGGFTWGAVYLKWAYDGNKYA